MEAYNNTKCLESISENLQKSIRRIINDEGYKSFTVEVNQINTKGASFIGVLFEIDIRGETSNGKKEVNIFVKQKKEFEKIVLLNPSLLYEKESFLYKELSEIFNYLQDKANIPPNDRFKLAKSFNETSPDAIFLENLTRKGFKIYNRLEELPLKVIELAVQEIAKFHSLGFVIQEKMVDYHDNNIKVLENPLHYDKNFECIIHNISEYVADICDENRPKVLKFMSVFFEKYEKYKNDKTSTRCCLSHGDFRLTNILVRDDNGEPKEVILVDYQFIDYGCPLRDLLYFLTANTDQETRRSHMHALKELYYSTLSRYLKYFNMNVERVYPRNEFERVFSEWFSYGLMMVFLYLPVLYAPETGIDFSTISLSEVPLDLNEKNKDRIRKLIQDFIDWGYL